MKPLTCPVCHDQRMVELKGTSSDGYSRGSAPCQFCEGGRKLAAHLAGENQHPLTDYSMHSLASPAQGNYRAVTKEEALLEWNTCIHQWQNDGEPQARPWAKDSIQSKTCTRCRKQQVDVIPNEPHHVARRSDR